MSDEHGFLKVRWSVWIMLNTLKSGRRFFWAMCRVNVGCGLFASMLPWQSRGCFFRDMVIAGTAIADPEDSRASASLWHG
ncbi:hypothetical protein SY26_18970 [Paracoccus sp. 228]|nr:hypothetical protein SY26_18970 [Paracoccus sp. 228]